MRRARDLCSRARRSQWHGIPGSKHRSNSESAALLLLPPPLRSPRQTRCRRSRRRRRRRRLAPRLRHRRPPSRGGVPLTWRGRLARRRLAAAPLSPPLRSWPPPPLSIPPSAPPLPPPRASPPPPSPSPSPLSGCSWRVLASLSHRPGRGAAQPVHTLSPSLYSDCAAGAATHAVGCLGQRREPRGGPPLTALPRGRTRPPAAAPLPPLSALAPPRARGRDVCGEATVGRCPTRSQGSGPARGPQRVSMRGGDGVPWPAAGADFLEFFSFFRDFYLFSWEFGVLAAMLSRLATACRRS